MVSMLVALVDLVRATQPLERAGTMSAVQMEIDRADSRDE